MHSSVYFPFTSSVPFTALITLPFGKYLLQTVQAQQLPSGSVEEEYGTIWWCPLPELKAEITSVSSPVPTELILSLLKKKPDYWQWLSLS